MAYRVIAVKQSYSTSKRVNLPAVNFAEMRSMLFRLCSLVGKCLLLFT